jgi:hypothetical protein
MKRIITALLLVSFCLFLHSMDLNTVPFLPDKKILEQQADNYFYQTLPTLKLCEINEKFTRLPDDCRDKILDKMSDNLCMLHYVALVPEEIQKKILYNIFRVTFDGDREAMEIFYLQKPLIKALQLYDKIKKVIRSGESAVPLYKMPQRKREAVLGYLDILDPWYSNCVPPIMSIAKQREIHELDEDVQHYFKGKKIAFPCGVGDCNCTTGAGTLCLIMTGMDGFIVSVFACNKGCVPILLPVGCMFAGIMSAITLCIGGLTICKEGRIVTL